MSLYVMYCDRWHDRAEMDAGMSQRQAREVVDALANVARTVLLGDNRDNGHGSCSKGETHGHRQRSSDEQCGEVRERARRGELTGLTAGMASGFAQAKMASCPASWPTIFSSSVCATPSPARSWM